jgi:MFS family permease
MRKTIIAGLVLALAAALVMWLSAAFDLELESVVLMGAAVGAVLALVPDRSPLARFLGFAAGFVVTWVGYAVRALLLPDTEGGRAVAVALILLLCVGVFAASAGHLPLWSMLLGAAAVSGGYEYTYAAAPQEMGTTAVSAATSLLFCIAVGFLVAATVAPHTRPAGAATSRPGDDDLDNTTFDDLMMEKTK